MQIQKTFLLLPTRFLLPLAKTKTNNNDSSNKNNKNNNKKL